MRLHYEDKKKEATIIKFLTEQMVNNFIYEIALNQNINFTQQQAEIFVLNHIASLLREGKTLTINNKGEMKMWKERREC